MAGIPRRTQTACMWAGSTLWRCRLITRIYSRGFTSPTWHVAGEEKGSSSRGSPFHFLFCIYMIYIDILSLSITEGSSCWVHWINFKLINLLYEEIRFTAEYARFVGHDSTALHRFAPCYSHWGLRRCHLRQLAKGPSPSRWSTRTACRLASSTPVQTKQ